MKQAVVKDGESFLLFIIMIIIIMMKQAVGKDGESLLLLVARALGLQSRWGNIMIIIIHHHQHE